MPTPTNHKNQHPAHKGGFAEAMNEALHLHRKDEEFHRKDGSDGQNKKASEKKDPPGDKATSDETDDVMEKNADN